MNTPQLSAGASSSDTAANADPPETSRQRVPENGQTVPSLHTSHHTSPHTAGAWIPGPARRRVRRDCFGNYVDVPPPGSGALDHRENPPAASPREPRPEGKCMVQCKAMQRRGAGLIPTAASARCPGGGSFADVVTGALDEAWTRHRRTCGKWRRGEGPVTGERPMTGPSRQQQDPFIDAVAEDSRRSDLCIPPLAFRGGGVRRSRARHGRAERTEGR
ncbi:hypothetical protein VTN02DRAFT_3714 [Thermoascus thermophilus]